MASVVLFLLPPLLALLPELRAQEVLVPEFTPTEFTDIEVASSVYTRTLDRLASLGVPCVDAAGLRLVVGNEADMCGDEPTCPGSLWPSFPKARVAIVGGVARGDGTIVMRVDFYTPSTFVPVETVEQVMMESGYETMAQGIADATVRILENIRAAETEAAAAVPETRPRGRKVLEAGKGRNLEVETLGAEPRPGKPDARAQSAEKKPKAEKPKAEKPKAEKPGEKTPREKASREDKSEPVAASRPPETRPTEQKPSSSPASSTSTRPNVVVSSVSPPRRKGEPVRKPEPGASATGTSWWRPWARYRAWMAARHPYYLEPAARSERRAMRIPWALYDSYRASEKKRLPWLAEHHIVDSRFSAEAWLGYTRGDVNRSYHVRRAFEASTSEALGLYQTDSFTSGNALLLGASASAGLTWWSELGLRVGFVTGSKDLSTGWQTWRGAEPLDVEVADYAPAPALRALIEPRLRILPRVTGRLRPYALAAFALQFYDAYRMPDEGTGLVYPERAGGMATYLGGGAGLEYLLQNRLYVSGEILGAGRLSPGASYRMDSPWITEKPVENEPARASFSLGAGVGWRF